MTIKEIAENLGVSISTVSKALNNATDISEETKKRVLDYVYATDFSRKKHRSNAKRVGLFLEEIGLSSEQIGYDILTGFKEMAEKYNYEVVIKSTTHDDTDVNYDAIMAENSLLGSFVLGANLNSALYDKLTRTKYPTVVMDNFIMNQYVSSIGVDNINTVAQMVSYLVSLGHRRIGFINGEKGSVVSRERLSGYICGLMDNEIEFDPQLVAFGAFTEKCGEEYAPDLLEKQATAIMCACDLTAIGAVNALKSRGIRVPEDVSVTGYDDIVLSRYVTPSITTIKQDFVSIGKNGFSILRQMLKGASPERVILNGALMIRDSAAERK